MDLNQNLSAVIILTMQWYIIKTNLHEFYQLRNGPKPENIGRQYRHILINTSGDSKKIPVSLLYTKIRKTMIQNCKLVISVTLKNCDFYLYLRHHINPAKLLGADKIQPYAFLCPSRENIRGLSHRMKIYDKSTISSPVVRVITFSIGEYLFCLVIFILSTRISTG